MGKALNGKNLGKGFSQRKDGRYEARATINGVKIDLYDMSLLKLKKAFELKKAEVLRDEKGVRPNVTLKDWYEEWFEKFKVPQLKSTSSIKSYNRKTKNTFIATKIVQNINLRELYKASAEGRPPKTFERLHPHAFRHTFATRCFEKGLDPLFIQSIMGHANYSTTISYTHVLDDTISKEVKKAGNFLS